MREDSLSPREREIAEAYANGDTYHAIAGRLNLAPSTVRTHLSAIYRKLGVSSKLELHKVLQGGRPAVAAEGEQAAVISELALSLEEAISRERALGEVLRIISGASGDLEKVMAAVLRYALELCDAEFGLLLAYTPKDGFRSTFTRNIPAPFARWFADQGAFHVGAETALGRVAAHHDVVNIADVCAEDIAHHGDPLRDATVDLGGARSFAALPMLAGDRLIGAFTVYRQRVRPFDERTLEVAKLFAVQSVIAIENARLIGEKR